MDLGWLDTIVPGLAGSLLAKNNQAGMDPGLLNIFDPGLAGDGSAGLAGHWMDAIELDRLSSHWKYLSWNRSLRGWLRMVELGWLSNCRTQ
jgi:hypothetical protein